MEKLFIWKRLCGTAISAGMLTGVLLFCGCRTSLVSSTTARSDSTQYSVTVVSTIEPVPKKQTEMVLTQDRLTRLIQLPQGYSLSAEVNEGIGTSLWVESDGKGGLNVRAETPVLVTRKDSVIKKVETHIRDETTVSEKNNDQPLSVRWYERMSWMSSVALVLMVVVYIIRKKLKNF